MTAFTYHGDTGINLYTVPGVHDCRGRLMFFKRPKFPPAAKDPSESTKADDSIMDRGTGEDGNSAQFCGGHTASRSLTSHFPDYDFGFE